MSTEIKSAAQFKKLLESAIKKGDVLVVKFYFQWCGHCQRIKQPFEKLAKARPEFRFASLDMEKVPAVADALDIHAGPTFLVFWGNSIVGKVNGANLAAVEQILNKIMP